MVLERLVARICASTSGNVGDRTGVAEAARDIPSMLVARVLAGAFAAMLLVDLLASRSGQAPAWYPALRWPLTIAVAASLILGAAA